MDTDGEMKGYEAEIENARGLLEPASGEYGVDYGLMIPALLILRRRQQAWSAKSNVSTQCILDASCHAAGRHDKEKPQFVFDAPTVMRQCAISGNISAGAYLVGGKNGFVLQCCKSLIDTLNIDMDRAESIVLKDDIDLDTLKSVQGKTKGRFTLSDEHRRLLWLLCEHVLKVRTFGNFHAVGLRGRVDPVFAARSCFRTWFLLSDSGESTPWLTRWLRQRLLISQGESSQKRLACAALIRALVWPTKGGSDQILGTMMNVESTFLVQLARSCSGLVESVPEQIADTIITKADAKCGTNAMASTTAV